MSLESFQAQGQAHVGGVAIHEPVVEASRPLPMVEGKGKAIATEEQAAQSMLALHMPKRRSTTDQFIFQRQTLAAEEALTRPFRQPQDDTSANIVCKTPSLADVETSTNTKKVISEGDTEILNTDEDQAGSDPGKSHVALVGPNPEPIYDDFVDTVFPKVHESLKFLADEQVILKDPPSSSGTLSSMKNLDDTYTFQDQFFNDKSTEDEPEKQNVDTKVVSMKSQTLDNATQNLRSRVLNLELRDLPHKVNQTVNEVFKEAVHISLQAPLRYRFRELSEADMQEIHHQRMFESGYYKSLPKYFALYEALEASIERMEECHRLLTDQVDLINREGHQLVPDVSKPLPLGGPSFRNIVIRQRAGDLQLGIKSYQIRLNITEPRWDALDFLLKEDYTIVSKLSAVIYKDRNDQKKMLRENEVHKFSDGTLTRVLHKLYYMVKDFRLY
nr:hypothetical protein [Tanacetum cinerariifolium]